VQILRKTIAYVPQEITLFNDTVQNNIIFGNTHHRLSDVRKASTLADAHTFIKKLPGFYDFKVGEAGNFLSGGQRQRLMLARAFMKTDASILLFDESFSALDVRSRQIVLNNLKQFSDGKTTVMISNIFDVISLADNVVIFNHGKLLYSGPSTRLPKEISLYKMIEESEPEVLEQE
jgi:subfamily B ATP-binding cassette protein MsbA